MANIREFHDFKGDDVILLWLTRNELRALRQELGTVQQNGRAAITLGQCHLVLKKHGVSGVNLSASETQICLTDTDVEQFEGLLDGLLLGDGPGHQYMDIAWPVRTLMISVGEYPADLDVR
jgi:hypothetical protein